jgi:putative transcriptional regulator
MNQANEIGSAVRIFRAANGKMSQAELADRAGLARDTISRIECGTHKPNSATVVKIADALGVEAGLLMGQSL